MITEDQIATLVDAFYARVREDPVLGPVFNHAVADWPEHLARLRDFWSSVMQASGRYKGNPMRVHFELRDAIEPAMFDRWLALWRSTAAEVLPADSAAAFVDKAERIAESLKLGLWFKL